MRFSKAASLTPCTRPPPPPHTHTCPPHPPTPQVLISGIISKAADVFSFGVLMWQMYTSTKPWAGMNHGQIIYNVGMKNLLLVFPPETPTQIEELSISCMNLDPALRPSMEVVCTKLAALCTLYGVVVKPPLG